MPGNFDGQSSTFYSYVFDLGDDAVEREDKYTNCWNFYEGKQWDQTSPEGFDQIVINYCKVFSKKMRRFAFRNDWTMDFSDEHKKLGIDKWVQDAWKQNDLHEITNKLADFGSIFGDFYPYVNWVPKTEIADGYIKITPLDPRTVFPMYNGKTGEMEHCIILFPYRETITNEESGQLEVVIKWYREVHTADKIYVHTATEKSTMQVEEILENPLNKMLIVHGINQPVAGSNFGCSDIEDIIDSQELLNEKVSNISDILDYHAAPVTIIKGAKAKQLEKGANKVWSGLPANADVFNLASAGNIPESMKFIEFLKQTMHEISNITEESLGGGRAISNTSAVALSLDFEPMIELAEDKRFYFAKAIKKVNELIIDIGIENKKISAGNLKGSALYEHSITFGALLPRDRQADLMDISTEMSLGLEEPEGALVRLGDINPKKKLIKVKAYKKEQAKLMPTTETKTLDEEMEDAEKSVNKNPKSHGEQVVAEEVKKRVTS